MSHLKKILGVLSIFTFLSLLFAPMVKADSILDDIKAKLQSQGVEVVDYSSQEGTWGALPDEWITLLSKEGYSGIEELASLYESHFDGGITEKRRELALAETEKTRLTNTDEIATKNDQIAGLQDDLDELMADFQDELLGDILGFDFEGVGQNPTDQEIEEGVNLLAKEIDFYFNYNKWGPLPLKIVGLLEEIGTQEGPKYKDLEDMAEQHHVCNPDPEMVKKGDATFDEFFGAIEDLTPEDRELLKNSLKIVCAKGEAQINKIGQVIANSIENIAGGLAVLWIVVAGIRMILAQGDESAISEQKMAILYGVIGLVVILLVGRMVDVLYGPAGVNRTSLVNDEGFNVEVYGIVSFIKALLGVVAILFIVVSGIRTIFAQGEEAEITNQRTSLLWIGVGLIMIAINRVIIENIFINPTQQQSDQIQSSNISAIINTFGNVLKFILGFVGLITLGLLIYGAATMIMNYGDPEMVEKSKKIIKNAIIGIVIILSAYVIVASLVVFG